jgi:hypothetical protein
MHDEENWIFRSEKSSFVSFTLCVREQYRKFKEEAICRD